MAEKKEEAKKVDRQKFIERKLKAINNMPNKAKAKALAYRVMNAK